MWCNPVAPRGWRSILRFPFPPVVMCGCFPASLPGPCDAGPAFGLGLGAGVESDFHGSGVAAVAPLRLTTSYLMRDESQELEGAYEPSFGPTLSADAPRYVLGLTLNTEKAYRSTIRSSIR
jgi:hypothetical protein